MTSRSMILAAVCTAFIFFAGCAQRTPPSIMNRSGPSVLAHVEVQPWTYGGEPARRVVTRHYVIYATVANDDFLQSMGQLMEGALSEYRLLVPSVPDTDRPMECFLFANRTQWAQFTRQKTGNDAAVYLQINRGGYTVRDWYVAFFLGDVDTFCVASHEGFHQYASRHFKTRVPPFLEEGLACLFENVSWDGHLPRWDLSNNYDRREAMKRTVEKNLLISLGDLATLHAGQIISRSTEQVAGFYAQSWGFARFLWEYNGGQYRESLQHMLSDASDGTLFAAAPTRNGISSWDPKSSKPMLEHYLGRNLSEIDREYQLYIRKLVGERE